MVRLSKPQSLVCLGVGLLALVMVQGQVKAQFAWHGPFSVTTTSPTTFDGTGVTGNPSFIQATSLGFPNTYGAMGNYELVVPLRDVSSGGMGHFFRNNDDPNLTWSGPFPFAADSAVDAVSLIQSNFTSSGTGPGNLAVVARIGNELDYYFREDVTFTWSGVSQTITTAAHGVPSFIQAKAIPGFTATYGTMGNYELVTPLESGGIGHFFRENDVSLAWSGPTATFGTELGIVDAVSLIQTNFSTTGIGPGNLAVVARVGSNLYYFERTDDASFTWSAPTLITTPGLTTTLGVTGNPSLIQAPAGTYGVTKGNFELVVPLRTGGLGHFFRDNDASPPAWSGPIPFGDGSGGTGNLGAVDGCSLILSNFSSKAAAGMGPGPGNLAVITVTGNRLDYFYRDDF